MKTLTAIATLTLLTLFTCGNEDELKAVVAKADALAKENATLKAKATELEGRFATVSGERDELKAQLEKAVVAAQARPPPPAASPAPPPAGKKPGKPSRKK